jgi:hypothetical protein
MRLLLIEDERKRAGLLTGLFLLLGVTTLFVLQHYLDANVRDSQWRRAREIAQALSPELIRRGPAAIAGESESLFSPAMNNRFVRIRRANGTVLSVSKPPRDRGFDPAAVPPAPWPESGRSSLKVESTEGEGSRFRMSLPLATAVTELSHAEREEIKSCP